MGYPYRRGDRPFKELFFRQRKHLIMSLLLLSVLPQFCKSQISNELAFDSLFIGHLNSNSQKIGKFTGFMAERWNAEKKTSPDSNQVLHTDPPMVEFEKLVDGNFRRTLQVDLRFDQDSTAVQNFALSLVDTIAARDFKKIRQSKWPALRGEDPRWSRKFLLPFGGIAGGIAGIISLFYIRSGQQ